MSEKALKIGMVMDPIESIAPYKDSSLAMLLEASRRLVYNAARMKDNGDDYVVEAAMAKLFSSINAEKVTSRMIEIFGGYGFTKDFPVEKFYRDAKLCTIGEGTSEIQKLVISRNILS